MLLATQEIHRRVADLGKDLGFVVTREVSDSLLRLRLDDTYKPRIDLLWSLVLDDQKRQALAWVMERELTDVTHLPVVGVEVEGTTPTTKTMGADVANLAALGVPLGLLVVSEEGEKNIYRRAARAIRSVRRSFGDLRLLPVEAGWLDLLLQREWPAGLSSIAVPKRARPAGGETLAWSAATRDRLRSLGEEAGFVVAEPYTPPVLDAAFDLICRQRAKPPVHTCDPLAGTVKMMTKAGDLFTGCKIDLAWMMPLPKALSAFLEAVFGHDACLRDDGMVFPDLWTHVPVVAFELESSGGKHAGGGLLNLSAYAILGVAVAPNSQVAADIAAALRTYQPTLGLHNVFVRTVTE
jgi:hypothetical protein